MVHFCHGKVCPLNYNFTEYLIFMSDTVDCCCCCCLVTSVVSDSVRSHRRQPTRLPRPWDSPGKNTGVGCHFLLQYMQVKSESEVAQSCPTLSDPMDCSPPGSSVHGIFQQEYWSGVPLPSPLSSLTRNQMRPLIVKTWHPNHWTAREFPFIDPLKNSF